MRVKNDDLYPRLDTGDIVLVQRKIGDYKYKVGDIVAYKRPDISNAKIQLDEVVGVPGDVVEVIRGDVCVNKNEVVPSKQWKTDPYRLGKDEYYVVSKMSRAHGDSRAFGALQSDNIKGKVVKSYKKNEEL